MHVLNYQGKIKDTISSYTVKCDNEMYGMFCSQLNFSNLMSINLMWWIIESKKYSCIFRMTQLCNWICNNLSCMHLLLLTEIAIIFYSITENKPYSDIGCCLAGQFLYAIILWLLHN